MTSDNEHTNQILAGYLTRLGWSTPQLARHLNELAASLRLPDRVHPKTPRRWLHATAPCQRPSVPHTPWPGLVCALLAKRLHEPVTLTALGWQHTGGAVYVPADDGLDHAWTPPGATATLREALEADGMDRRHFITISGTALTAVAHDWLLEPSRIAAAVQGRRIDQSVVTDLEQLAEASRRLDDALGGGAAVFRTVREHLRLVLEILDHASYTEPIGKGLYAVAAEFARLAGMLAYDLNQHARAQRFYIAALRAAHSGDDRAIGARILSEMSEQARYFDPRDAIRLAESGLVEAEVLSPAVAAQLHGNLAKAAASSGDVKVAESARGRMFELTAASNRSDEPPWMYWWSEPFAFHCAGRVAQALDDHRRAEGYLRDALATLPPEFQRPRGKWLPLLAIARVRLGELEGACRSATEAATIARKVGSERVRTRLIEFRRAVAPHANAQAVKQFDATFPDLLRGT